MANLQRTTQVKNVSRETRLRVRQLYHSGHLTLEKIREAIPSLTESQLNEIISEPDDLEDFRLEKFNTMIRELDDLAMRTIKSIREEDLAEATISARGNLIKSSNDTVRRLYELAMVERDKSDDMALARLMSLGRDEARRQLTERFRALFHILFSGQKPEEVATQLGLMELKGSAQEDAGPKKYALDDDISDAEVENDGPPQLGLVSGGQPHTTQSGGSGDSAQGIGAFRGVKKSKPS